MNKLLADINFSPPGGFTGPAGGIFADPATNTGGKFEILLSRVIGVLTIIAGIWFMFVLLTGAVGIIASGGDKGAYESARKRITTGLTGLVVVVISVALISLIGRIIGLDILNVATFITALTNL